MDARWSGAGVPGVAEEEGARKGAQSTRRSEASAMARWLGLGFREASARSRGRALEIWSTTEQAFRGTDRLATMSKICARVRGVSRYQKEAAPSWELTETRRRTARVPAGSRARVR